VISQNKIYFVKSLKKLAPKKSQAKNLCSFSLESEVILLLKKIDVFLPSSSFESI